MIPWLRDSARGPLILLALVSVLSVGARAALLGEPCQSPCTKADQHTLIFDEAYYVNAARVIAGIRPPAGSHYADAPLGTDPNAEHPQLARRFAFVSDVLREVVADIIEVRAQGEGDLAQLLDLMLVGDFVSLQLAAREGIDPGPVPILGELKRRLLEP